MAAPTLTAANNFLYTDGYWTRDQTAYTASKLPAHCGPAGTTVRLIGTNLDTTTAVHFGSAAAASFVIISSTLVQAVVPVTTSGSTTVTVTNPDGEASTAYTVGFWGPWITPPGNKTSDVSNDALTHGGYKLTTTISGTSPPDPTGTALYAASGDGPHLDVQCIDGTPDYTWSISLTLALLYWFFTPTDASSGELFAAHSLMTTVTQVEFEEAGGHADGPATITLHPGGSGNFRDATVTDPTGGPVPPPFTNLVQYRQLDPADYYMTTVGGTNPHFAAADQWPSTAFLASKPVVAESPIAGSSSELVYDPGDFANHPHIDAFGHSEPDVTIVVPLADLGPAPGGQFSSVTFCVVGMFDTYLDGSFTVPDPTDFDQGAIEHLQSINTVLDGTILYQPARYRLLYDRPQTAPPPVRQRQIPGEVRQRQIGRAVRQRQIPR